MARLEERTIKTIHPDSEMGGEHSVELPNGKTVYGVTLTATKGTLDSGSYNDAEIIADMFDNIEVAVQGESFTDVRGEVIRTFDVRNSGEPTENGSTPSGADRRGQLQIPFADPVPTAKVSEKEVNLNLAAIGDISGGTSQSGAEIQVGILVGDTGSFSQYSRVRRVPDTIQTGDGRRTELDLVGQLNQLAVDLSDVDLSRIKVTAILSGDQDEVLLDVSRAQLEEHVRKQVNGSGDLRGEKTFIPLKSSIDYSRVEELVFELDNETKGDIEFFPLTTHEAEKTLTA